MADHDDPTPVVPGRPRLVDAQGNERKMDNVPVAQATAADLQAYSAASNNMARMQVPVLVSSERPNERLFVAALDGTGNDMNDPSKGPRTGVAQIFQEIRTQQSSGQLQNVAAGYVPGPGTGSFGIWDGARGHTFEERSETMYRQFIEQSGRWLRENPNADIRVAAIGFSRGAEEAAYFTRLVDQRGIQDPTGAVYKTGDDGLVTSVRYTKPPLVAPGEVKQAALLEDPVATGDPRNYDRRLPPSVVSALQITARDETRDQFVGTRHIPSGFSDNQRSLNITVPGSHSDIGDGYTANGLGIRNTNMAKQYLNGLVDNDRPLLTLRPEAQNQHRSNVIHDSEQHLSWIYTRMGFDRDGVRDVNTQLAATRYETHATGRGSVSVPAAPTAEERRREPMDQQLANGLEYRALPIAPVPALASDQRGAALQPSAVPTTNAAATLPESTHIGHRMYQQALVGLESAPNLPPETFATHQQRSHAASALTAASVEGQDPLKQINAVVMNRQADGLIAIEGGFGDPTSKMRAVPLAQVFSTSERDYSDRVHAALTEQPVRSASVLAAAPQQEPERSAAPLRTA